MDTVSLGRHALAMALAGMFAAPAQADENIARIVVRNGEARQLDHTDSLHVSGDMPIGIYLFPRASLDADSLSIVHDGTAGHGYGILAHDGAEAALVDSRIDVRGHNVIGIQAQGDAMVDLRNTVVKVSRSAGPYARALALAGGTAMLRGTLIDALDGHAISTHFTGSDTSHVFLENATVRGRIGSGTTGLDIASVDSHIDGAIIRDGDGALALRMLRGGWRGEAGKLSTATFEDSTWTVTADSTVAALHLAQGGRIAFDRTARGFRTLRVGEWRAGAGAGGVVFGTRLDAGGTLDRQATDRLLIAGDTAGVTPVHVDHAGGNGASTAGRDGVNGAGDGISLVQVGGKTGADAFRLAGDYVAIGPWQYRLHSYEPGRSDPSQRLLDGQGGDFWDFRLQSTHVDAAGTTDGRPAVARGALVPHAPAYLVLSHALFGYGMAALDALVAVDPDPGREPALRVRAFGGGMAYRSTLPFDGYGFHYRRHDRGLQVAGDLLIQAFGDTTVRAGAAASLGGSRITPRAIDGQSEARVGARGLAMYAALTTASDWRVASTYAITHYRVGVRTPWRGEVLGRMRANANEATLSAAYRWRPATRWLVEPGVSTAWQRLRFSRVVDRDGIDVQGGRPERTTLRAGARASLAFLPEGRVLYGWSPYVDMRYAITRGAGESAWLSGERFATGRARRGIELSTGARFHLWSRVTTYVDMTTRLRVGDYGESGLSARAGFALAF